MDGWMDDCVCIRSSTHESSVFRTKISEVYKWFTFIWVGGALKHFVLSLGPWGIYRKKKKKKTETAKWSFGTSKTGENSFTVLGSGQRLEFICDPRQLFLFLLYTRSLFLMSCVHLPPSMTSPFSVASATMLCCLSISSRLLLHLHYTYISSAIYSPLSP